jgi:hypothetical protein
MTTSISIHHVESISASTVQGGQCSPHLTINWRGSNCDNPGSENYEAGGAITFYLKDAALNDRLIKMINQMVREHAEQKEGA